MRWKIIASVLALIFAPSIAFADEPLKTFAATELLSVAPAPPNAGKYL